MTCPVSAGEGGGGAIKAERGCRWDFRVYVRVRPLRRESSARGGGGGDEEGGFTGGQNGGVVLTSASSRRQGTAPCPARTCSVADGSHPPAMPVMSRLGALVLDQAFPRRGPPGSYASGDALPKIPVLGNLRHA